MTSTTDLPAFFTEAREAVNRELERWCQRVEQDMDGRVGAAIAYSLRAPGKRLRPALVMAAHRELGGTGDAAELAAAVEVVHTYSLVHDDLPCMDNDDLRRGRPTTHKQFDVPTATEAGFRMVPLSARVLAAGAARLGLDHPTLGAIAGELYRAAGASGMVGGQVMDLEAEGKEISLEELEKIHRAKTGALITASVVMGAMAANASSDTVGVIREYGGRIGLAFQIVDDVLDETGTSSELGKTAGKDAAQHKATFATLLGVDEAMKRAHTQADQAVALLRGHGLDCESLEGLARFIVERRR
jgi:farnesyl diphosphate synthase/geranylgeranyl diphosphate synthase type II